MTRRTDPYRNFRFRVDIDGKPAAGFSDVTIPESTTEATDYREGIDAPNLTYKVSGRTTYGDVTLKNGFTESLDLYKWKRDVELKGASEQRKTIGITLVNEEGDDTASWDIQAAWPTRYEASELSAAGNDVVIQTLTLTHEGIERKK